QCEIVERYADDRCRLGMTDCANAGNDRGNVPQPVLRIESDSAESFARDGLGNDWRAHHAPGRIDSFPRAQAPGEGKSRHVSRSSSSSPRPARAIRSFAFEFAAQ